MLILVLLYLCYVFWMKQYCLFPLWTAFLIDLRKPFFNPSCIIPHLNCNKCFCPVCSCCCCYVASVMSDSVRPQRQQPTRLPCPWDSPGRNTGVGCHLQWSLKHKKKSCCFFTSATRVKTASTMTRWH